MGKKRSDNSTFLQINLAKQPESLAQFEKFLDSLGVDSKKSLFLKYHALFCWVEGEINKGNEIFSQDVQGRTEKLNWKMLMAG
jgi:hypothetical protein